MHWCNFKTWNWKKFWHLLWAGGHGQREEIHQPQHLVMLIMPAQEFIAPIAFQFLE